MNSNKILSVYANSRKSNLGLGDYIRIVSFLPNLKFKKIHWYCNKDLFPLIKSVNFINNVYNLNKIESNKFIGKDVQIINLYENGKNKKNCLFINNFFNKSKNIKQNTLDLYFKLSKYYKIKKYKIYTNNKKKIKKDIDIFFNWSAPKKWKKKELPKIKWLELENRISKKYNKIIWQNPKDNLKKYIEKIQRSKKVISIVGLGNHLSTLYNIPTVILCGPTFFNEAKKHKNVNLIFPKVPCDNKCCKKNNFINHCGKMEHININDIIKKL